MTRNRRIVPFLAVSLLAFAAGRLVSQEGAAPPDLRELMERSMEAAQPGPEHDWLSTFSGRWRSSAKIWMQPGAEPLVQEGEMEARMVLGGRWLEQRSRGAFFGRPIEGVSYFGFDRRHGEFCTVGFDTLGTYFVTGRGKRRADGTVVMEGKDDDLMGRQVYRFEIERKSDDAFLVRIVFTELGGRTYPDGFTMMEIDYERLDAASDEDEG